MWGPWNVFPPTSEQQKKQWQDIPGNVFWIKITVILFITAIIGLILFLIINS